MRNGRAGFNGAEFPAVLRRPSLLSALRWIIRIVVAAVLLLALWVGIDTVTRPLSTLMMARSATGQPVDRRWVELSDVSPALVSAVILSEDGQFCRHHGVDWGSLKEVVRHGRGAPSRGASTLTMQVAKNLFLWPGRSYVRKAIEIPLALVLDALWGKKRILEYYLNVAELGDGVFGVEAAAQMAFHASAKTLTPQQAAVLATSLPNPFLRRADKPSRLHRALANRLVRMLPDAAGHVGCLR